MSEDNSTPEVTVKEVEKTERPKASWFWIKNSAGQASLSVTFLTVSFLVTTAAYVASMFEEIGPLKLRPFDVGATTSYFIPLLTLYFGRRWTDAKFSGEK
jgi:hypothetical protein